jgi:hypothetical protein
MQRALNGKRAGIHYAMGVLVEETHELIAHRFMVLKEVVEVEVSLPVAEDEFVA